MFTKLRAIRPLKCKEITFYNQFESLGFLEFITLIVHLGNIWIYALEVWSKTKFGGYSRGQTMTFCFTLVWIYSQVNPNLDSDRTVSSV